MFGQDLPKEAIEALRVAAMDKELSKALAVLAADLGQLRWTSHDGAHVFYNYSSRQVSFLSHVVFQK